MCQLPLLSVPVIASAVTPQGCFIQKTARNRKSQNRFSPWRAESVHLEGTRFNQQSDNPSPFILSTHIRTCVLIPDSSFLSAFHLFLKTKPPSAAPRAEDGFSVSRPADGLGHVSLRSC